MTASICLLVGVGTAPRRQQTLEAALDWSYVLLSEVEQKVLQRLSVFAGGCTLEAAEVVCAGDGVEASEVLNVLSHLIEKSIVQVAEPESSRTRYSLLETIRQYAREKLSLGDDTKSLERHATYFKSWVDQMAMELPLVQHRCSASNNWRRKMAILVRLWNGH